MPTSASYSAKKAITGPFFSDLYVVVNPVLCPATSTFISKPSALNFSDSNLQASNS